MLFTPLTIPAELEAELTPAVRAFVELLLARISDLESELEQLRGRMQRLQGTTPQNSSLPPSTQHPHAKPATRKQWKQEIGYHRRSLAHHGG